MEVFPLQFQQHRTQESIIRQVRDERGLSDCLNETRCFAPLGRPAEPVAEVGVGVGGVEYRRTSNCVLGRSSFR